MSGISRVGTAQTKTPSAPNAVGHFFQEHQGLAVFLSQDQAEDTCISALANGGIGK